MEHGEEKTVEQAVVKSRSSLLGRSVVSVELLLAPLEVTFFLFFSCVSVRLAL
jgi:hypothetical protein